MRARWIVLSLWIAATGAHAQEVDLTLGLARGAFTSAVQDYDAGRFEAALAGFLEAYEVSGNARVLYNVGATYVALERPIEAVAAWERFLAEATDASPELRRATEAGLADQRRRIARVSITTNVTHGELFVDGERRAALPLAGPLALAVGARTLEARALGYQAVTRRLTIDGPGDFHLRLELAPSPEAATLRVRTEVVDATVLVDGEVVGQTPLEPTLVDPGRRRVEVSRPGFVSFVTEVRFDARREAIVDAPLELDANASPEVLAYLRFGRLLHGTELFLDGLQLFPSADDLPVPIGRHALLARSSVLEPVVVSLDLAPGERRLVEIPIRYNEAAERRLTVGVRVSAWTLGVSAPVLVGGAALRMWQKREDPGNRPVRAVAVTMMTIGALGTFFGTLSLISYRRQRRWGLAVGPTSVTLDAQF
ncbi:MAG: PEGA domain-containing protein [Myxococcales bacterium]|nr:PEGA domain-containing protein [Myxococcales bacterium]